jgi:hypothetical protein
MSEKSESETRQKLDIELSEYDDFNNWWEDYWYKLRVQFGFDPDKPKED